LLLPQTGPARSRSRARGPLTAFADTLIDRQMPPGGRCTRRRHIQGVGRYPGTLQHVAAELRQSPAPLPRQEIGRLDREEIGVVSQAEVDPRLVDVPPRDVDADHGEDQGQRHQAAAGRPQGPSGAQPASRPVSRVIPLLAVECHDGGDAAQQQSNNPG